MLVRQLKIYPYFVESLGHIENGFSSKRGRLFGLSVILHTFGISELMTPPSVLQAKQKVVTLL
jgi:hypothetical protein